MGCSSSDSSSSGTTAQPSVTATTASSAALYSAGDIVKNPKSTTTSALIIISFDASKDMYERAYIYPNNDGSWGYRIDSKTEKISRSVIEKVYTQKVGSKTVSAVPISTPTPIATPTPIPTVQTTTSTATATATTSSMSAPHVTNIEPDTGKAGTTVSITELRGTNFKSNCSVALVKSGSSNIVATNVIVSASGVITCTIVIPSDASLGPWSVVVTNPDGQAHEYKNGFTIPSKSTVTSTTTTSSSSTTTATSVKITQIQDTLLVTGGTEAVKDVTILGTNLSVASKMQLVGSSTINSNGFTCESPTRCKGVFTIPSGVVGIFYVKVADSGGSALAQSPGTLTIQ